MEPETCNCLNNNNNNIRPNSGFRPTFLDTPFPGTKTVVDYIFVDHSGIDVLMKTKVVDFKLTRVEELPALEKAVMQKKTATIKQMLLKPVTLFPDPLRGGQNKIALCEIYEDDKPYDTNTRHTFCELLREIQIDNEDPWMGFEQEYFILDRNGTILGNSIPVSSFNSKVNYGPTSHLERQIAEQHLKACMLAGLSVYGTVKETHPGQWEYQLGPTGCLRLADELIVSRYLLHRVAEMFDVQISFDAVHYRDRAKTKIITSGLHLNYSTNETRDENGIEVINRFIKRLMDVETDRIFAFFDQTSGSDTKQRLSNARQFTFDDLNTKRLYFRIPLSVQLTKRGYFEDRRPSADCDPYVAMLGFLQSLYTDKLCDDHS